MVEDVGDTGGAGFGHKDMVTSIVIEGGREVHSPDAVQGPRLAFGGGVMNDHELAWGVDGVSCEVHGKAVDSVPG